ncbi:hypothetical protein [Sphaerothrix gracilis]|uniref:hypothetical protein n=1 Tax=Sphaerothrix gracilis TaxID=3151835 RepID=UPI0031FD4951
MDEKLEQLMNEILSLRDQIQEMRSIQQAQQESISSLIALSQQQTAVIEQQNSTLQRVVTNGTQMPL